MNIVLLHAVGNGALHAIEEEQAAEENEHDGEGGSEKKQVRRMAVARDGPAETINHASHGVKAVKPAPARWHERRRVGNGRGEHPELDEKGHDVADVAIESVKRGEPEANAKSRQEREEQKNGQPESSKHGANAVGN